uniref:Putative transposase (Putative), gypsy type n=1 Tax=Tanacetum cinerariifolium TaxID=118510 RepID=A0A6L2N021_TANCI|nr:putative transposase (putative), gypsy type [Tanacetum cinerariifolium]
MGRDTVQLETVVSTISQEYLLEFMSEYGISEALHPKLPGPEERIVDFPEGKVGVYTKFFEFANFRLPLSQFLFDIMGYYQIHLSQLSIIGAAKVSHFEINCRVHNIVRTLSLFRVFYIPSFNSGWMSFSKRPRKNNPQCYTKPLDSLKNWNNRFFWVDERVFPTIVDWRTSAPKDRMRAENTYSPKALMILNTHRTLIQKQPEALLCLVGLSHRYYLGDEVYPTFLHDNDRDMDLLSLIRAPNPTKVRTGTRPRAAHEVPLLTVTASRVIEMEDLAATTDSSREVVAPEVPPSENVTTTGVAPEAGQAAGIAATGPHVVKEYRKRGNDGIFQGNVRGRRSRIREYLFYLHGRVTRKHLSARMSITNGCLLDAPEACQDLVDHIAPPGYFSELRHLRNDDFLKQYNVNLAQKVATGSQLRLRLRENEIKNLETLLEAETDTKKVAEGKSAELSKELKNLRALFSDLEVSNNRLSQQVSTLQAHVMGEEKLKSVFEEFKQYEDNRVEQRCAKMDARLEALSIDFDEELYPHILTAIAGRRWVIGHGLRLAVMKCGESTELRQAFANVVSAWIANGMSEGLKHEVEHEKANLSLEAIEAYDPEAGAKNMTALHALKDLKYPIVDQLKNLKDVPIDVIMASLHLESDTGDDAPPWICELHPSSSQLMIPVYPEGRDPTDPWAYKEEILLGDVITANVSRVKKKKKCPVVSRTHGVGSAHHARSDGVPVSVPTVAPQGFAILLADAATQTEIPRDGASPRSLRSSFLPVMHN